MRFEMAKAGAQETGRDVATEIELAKQNQNTPAVKIFSTIVLRAFREKASDIHIDPANRRQRVRFRVDGMLRDLMEVPPEDQRRAGLAYQDPGRHGYCRTARAARRPHPGSDRRE